MHQGFTTVLPNQKWATNMTELRFDQHLEQSLRLSQPGTPYFSKSFGMISKLNGKVKSTVSHLQQCEHLIQFYIILTVNLTGTIASNQKARKFDVNKTSIYEQVSQTQLDKFFCGKLVTK
ncbi:hypothetical protein [Weissella hellenica]|uniref:hypothetical protein n=1 Tax=Weissella hellenica TaxID=46256 RepID=UPI003887CA24